MCSYLHIEQVYLSTISSSSGMYVGEYFGDFPLMVFIPHKFVVTSAFQAERKSYPVRWIIVVITVLSTLLLLIFCLVFYDRSNGFFRRQADKEAASKEKKNHLGKE